MAGQDSGPRKAEHARNDDRSRGDSANETARLGRYVILDKLGAGGMGEVWSAYDPELDRRVALKLLRVSAHPEAGGDPSSPSEATWAERMRSQLVEEARATARISHPHVVSIFDVGLHGGDVYLALELVEGESLRAWLDRRPRPWREVVAYMLAAGRGLAAVHEAGLVHLDFKPDNVLLGDDGRVCVADFGIAALGGAGSVTPSPAPSATESYEHRSGTQRSFVGGTRGYMAPEQANAGVVDARSDQFAYCVSFLEALAGRRPGAAGDLHAGPRRAWPHRLERVLVRGLDPDAAARHASMTALLLEIEDIAASPRVRPWAIAGACALALMAVAMPEDVRVDRCSHGHLRVSTIWSETRQAAIERAFAATNMAFAGATWGRIEAEVDRRVDRWRHDQRERCRVRPRDVAEAEVRDAAMACFDLRLEQLDGWLEVLEAASAEVVRKSMSSLGKLDRVEDCSDADYLARDLELPRDAERRRVALDIHHELVRLEAMKLEGRWAEHDRSVDEVARRAVDLDFAPLVVRTHLLKIPVHYRAHRGVSALEEATAAHQRAVVARDDARAYSAARYIMYVRGHVLGERGALEELYRASQAQLERAGNDPIQRAMLLYSVTPGWAMSGQLERAELGIREAIALTREHSHPEDTLLPELVNNLGVTLELMHRYGEALDNYRRSIDVAERIFTPEHPRVGSYLGNLGQSLVNRGQFHAGLRAVRRAVAIHHGSGHRDQAQNLQDYRKLGWALTHLGRHRDALDHWWRCFAILEKMGAKNYSRRMMLYVGAARAMVDGGWFEGASELLALGLDSAEEHSNSAGWRGRGLAFAALLELQVGDWERADDLAARALRQLPAVRNREAMAELRRRLGDIELERGHPERAGRWYREASSFARQAHGPEDNVHMAPFELALGRAALAHGRGETALAHAHRADELARLEFAADAPTMFPIELLRVRALVKLGRGAQAREALDRARVCFDPRQHGPAMKRALEAAAASLELRSRRR